MDMRKGTEVFLIVFMSFLLSGVPLPALETFELDGGLFFIGSGDPQSAPSPLLPSVGVTLPLKRSISIFQLEASFLLSGTWYQYANGRASPAEPGYRDYATACILADLRGRWIFLERESLSLGTDVGLSAFLRIPVPLGVSADAGSNFGNTLLYFYPLRFLYPATGVFGVYKITEGLDLKLALRVYWPLHLIWDGEQLPLPEGLLATGLIGLIWRLPATGAQTKS
jgi:hypothetical protein